MVLWILLTICINILVRLHNQFNIFVEVMQREVNPQHSRGLYQNGAKAWWQDLLFVRHLDLLCRRRRASVTYIWGRHWSQKLLLRRAILAGVFLWMLRVAQVLLWKWRGYHKRVSLSSQGWQVVRHLALAGIRRWFLAYPWTSWQR